MRIPRVCLPFREAFQSVRELGVSPIMLTLALVSTAAMRHTAVRVGASAPMVGRSALLMRAASPMDRSGVARMMCDAAAEEAPDPEVGKASFSLLDVRVGKIVEAWPHPDSDKLWCERIDVGEDAPREIASGLRAYYPEKEELEGRSVIVVCNLKAAKLAGFASNGMVLCASSEDKSTVKFVEPPADAKPGERVTAEGMVEEPAGANAVKKKKLMEGAAAELRAVDGVACYRNVPLSVAAGQCTTGGVAAGTIN